jgi:hypothetical protein
MVRVMYSYLEIQLAIEKYQSVTGQSEDDFWKELKTTREETIDAAKYPGFILHAMPEETIPLLDKLLSNHKYAHTFLKAYFIRKRELEK